jgi:hypothetical protein
VAGCRSVARGQPALAVYRTDPRAGILHASGLLVITLSFAYPPRRDEAGIADRELRPLTAYVQSLSSGRTVIQPSRVYTAIATGELAAVTNDIPLLTGHPATSLASLLRCDGSAY